MVEASKLSALKWPDAPVRPVRVTHSRARATQALAHQLRLLDCSHLIYLLPASLIAHLSAAEQLAEAWRARCDEARLREIIKVRETRRITPAAARARVPTSGAIAVRRRQRGRELCAILPTYPPKSARREGSPRLPTSPPSPSRGSAQHCPQQGQCTRSRES